MRRYPEQTRPARNQYSILVPQPPSYFLTAGALRQSQTHYGAALGVREGGCDSEPETRGPLDYDIGESIFAP